MGWAEIAVARRGDAGTPVGQKVTPLRPVPEASRLEPMNVVAAPGVPSEVPVGKSRTVTLDGEARLEPTWCFLAAVVSSVVLFVVRYFGLTAFEIIVFVLVFAWIAVFIRFLGLTASTRGD